MISNTNVRHVIEKSGGDGARHFTDCLLSGDQSSRSPLYTESTPFILFKKEFMERERKRYDFEGTIVTTIPRFEIPTSSFMKNISFWSGFEVDAEFGNGSNVIEYLRPVVSHNNSYLITVNGSKLWYYIYYFNVKFGQWCLDRMPYNPGEQCYVEGVKVYTKNKPTISSLLLQGEEYTPMHLPDFVPSKVGMEKLFSNGSLVAGCQGREYLFTSDTMLLLKHSKGFLYDASGNRFYRSGVPHTLPEGNCSLLLAKDEYRHRPDITLVDSREQILLKVSSPRMDDFLYRLGNVTCNTYAPTVGVVVQKDSPHWNFPAEWNKRSWEVLSEEYGYHTVSLQDRFYATLRDQGFSSYNVEHESLVLQGFWAEAGVYRRSAITMIAELEVHKAEEHVGVVVATAMVEEQKKMLTKLGWAYEGPDKYAGYDFQTFFTGPPNARKWLAVCKGVVAITPSKRKSQAEALSLISFYGTERMIVDAIVPVTRDNVIIDSWIKTMQLNPRNEYCHKRTTKGGVIMYGLLTVAGYVNLPDSQIACRTLEPGNNSFSSLFIMRKQYYWRDSVTEFSGSIDYGKWVRLFCPQDKTPWIDEESEAPVRDPRFIPGKSKDPVDLLVNALETPLAIVEREIAKKKKEEKKKEKLSEADMVGSVATTARVYKKEDPDSYCSADYGGTLPQGMYG